MTELYWEHVEGEQDHPNVAYVVTQRAQVAGGYLYRVLHYAYDRRIHSVGGLAFVPDLAPVALTPVRWTPCEAPRPDVECWHTGAGQAVVCLPLSRNEENE
jgi:hypothetical protein